MNFWEDKYRVEKDGRVYNIKTGKLIKPHLNKKGYLRISLNIDGKKKMMFIHRLIGLTYISNINNYPQIDHIDRNKLNNNVSNLRWVNNLLNQQNKKLSKSNQLHINLFDDGRIRICFKINNIRYIKYLSKSKTIEEAVIQRDLMLSMF